MPFSHELPIAENEAADSTRRRPIHVVHLVMALGVGGLERVVIELARRTERTRFRTTVVCIYSRGSQADDAESLGIPVVSLECGGRGLGTALYRLVRCLRRLRADVLHTHNPNPHLVGSIASMVLQLPVLINTKHGRNNPDLRKDVFFNRVASCLSDAIVAVSADAALVATSVERVPRRKVRMIHNGIELARFPYHDRSNRRQPISAIHVARLNVIKDQKTLLAAVRLVVDEVGDFRLTVVGDGPLRQELLQLRDQFGLGGSVEFLGERDDVPDLLARADLFVLSSLQEGLSLTLLEAMASGLPVVATDVGGNRELVSPWKTGLLVPKQSPEKLAAAILELVKRREVRSEMGRQGRMLVERQFSIEGMIRQYEDLYVQLVQQKARHLN